MMWFKKKCKECGSKATPNGCRFCLMMNRVKMLEEMYMRMGGFAFRDGIERDKVIVKDAKVNGKPIGFRYNLIRKV